MSNRYTTQFVNCLEKKLTKIFAHVTFGATGAPTLDNAAPTANSKGIVSVTRNTTGKFTFVFGTQAGMLDTYVKILDVNYLSDTSGISGVAPAAANCVLIANNVATLTSCSLQLLFLDYAGSAVDPATGEGMFIEFTFGDSTAP